MVEKLKPNIKSKGTIYQALKQLQKEKKITKATVKENGKRKVYYKLTDENTDIT
ncbi:helix-turn-helix transcriptional regulator [Methanocaldococcus jannaschii]|uniref:helix-turn-helix transcriptional regulator n=1 Tax=Methanocaldococcus jannaschii TaxID=2190 RepID=UPI00373AECDC